MAADDEDLRRHEREAAAALLLLLRRAQRLMRRSVRTLTLQVERLHVAGAQGAYLDQAVRTGGRQAVTAIRSSARAGAGRRWAVMTGLELPAEGGLYAAGMDAYRSQAAGDSLARQWHDLHANASVEERLTATKALKELQWRLDRIATTEAVDAWNDETSRLNDLAEAAGVEIVETWSAYIDRRTCKLCRELDGDMVVRPDRFPDNPPLHPNCRCILLTEVRAARKAA